jgi:hypothetical protein
MTIQRLPIRIAPIDDEPIDSWVEAYATRLRAEVGEMWTVLFPTIVRQQSIAHLYKRIGSREVDHLVRVTAIPSDVIMWTVPALTGHLSAASGADSHVSVGAWLRHSKFCPTCLAERNGRWRTSWRHSLVVACHLHDSMLIEGCSACGQPPRQRFTHRNVPKPGLCGERDPHCDVRGGPRVPTCGADLRLEPSSPAAQPVLEAQRALLSVIERARVGDASAQAQLDDALLVVRAQVGEASRPGHLAEIAALLPEAASVIGSPLDLDRLRWFSDRHRTPRPAPIPAGFGMLSDPVRSALIAIRDPHLRISDRLRHASATTEPMARLTADVDAQERLATRLPSLLWPETTLFLRPRLNGPTGLIRTFGPIALMHTGTSLPSRTLVDASGQRFTSKGLPYALDSWCVDRDGAPGVRALAELSLELQATPAPIDYARREQLAGRTPPLNHEDWVSIADATGTPRGGAKRLMFANAYTYELLTGGDPTRWQPAAQLEDPAFANDYRVFCVRMGRETASLLREHASAFLRRGGVDEPLRWAPGNAAGIAPPFMQRAWSLIDQRRSPGKVAAALGIDLEHLRLALMLHPRPQPPAPPPLLRNQLTPLVGPLSREALAAELEQGRGIRQIAGQIGRDRKTVASALRRHGLEIPPVGRRPAEVEREWLMEQYWTHGRPLPDIAAEVGMTPTNLSRRARALDVPLRGRGGPSHARPFASDAPPPSPLRDAMQGQGAVQRLERFREMAIDCNFAITARRIGVAQNTLTVQLQKLERATGLCLVARGRQGPGVVHQVTRDGLLLMRQFEAWRAGR